MENKKLFVERTPYEKDGKTYYSYCVKGVVRGVESKVLITPPDFGGYAVLDIVFNGEDKAELVVSNFEMKDASGKTLKGNTYAVRSVDEDGKVYECSIKPFRKSDKCLLNMLLD